MTLDEFITYAGNPGVTFVLGGICGFLGTRFTMSAAERKNYKQSQYQNGLNHKQEKEKRYIEFTNAMREYASRSGQPTLNEFHNISTSGDLYFNELRLIADAILDGNIDSGSRDRTFVPDMARAIQKTIPSYYETLSKIAQQIGVEYGGSFDRADYESIFQVVEKYPARGIMPPAANSLTIPATQDGAERQ